MRGVALSDLAGDVAVTERRSVELDSSQELGATKIPFHCWCLSSIDAEERYFATVLSLPRTG